MKSLVTKRSIAVGGHKTSISLEEPFWKGLKEIAANRDLTLSEMVKSINAGRLNGNLSSAIRLFVLDHYRTRIGTEIATTSEKKELSAPITSAP